MPVAYLLALPSFRSLTMRIEDIINAAVESTVLDVSSDKTAIRFAIPVERKTIIIRDTPEDVTEEEVRSIMEGFPISALKKEVGSSWFITFPDEATALAALNHLDSQSLHNQPVKARVKSEFYHKALTNRMKEYKESLPKRKLSSTAAPFTMPDVPTSFAWGGIGLPNGCEYTCYEEMMYSFGYYNYTPAAPVSLPLVITAPAEKGYEGEFIHYSAGEINDIVRQVKDTSLPPVEPGAEGLDIVGEGRGSEM